MSQDNLPSDVSAKTAGETGSGGVGRQFYVEMGAFSPRLADQEVGQFLTTDELDRFQLMADSLTVVIVHGLVPNVVGNRGRDKLAKKIIKALKQSSLSATQPPAGLHPCSSNSPKPKCKGFVDDREA